MDSLNNYLWTTKSIACPSIQPKAIHLIMITSIEAMRNFIIEIGYKVIVALDQDNISTIKLLTNKQSNRAISTRGISTSGRDMRLEK